MPFILSFIGHWGVPKFGLVTRTGGQRDLWLAWLSSTSHQWTQGRNPLPVWPPHLVHFLGCILLFFLSIWTLLYVRLQCAQRSVHFPVSFVTSNDHVIKLRPMSCKSRCCRGLSGKLLKWHYSGSRYLFCSFPFPLSYALKRSVMTGAPTAFWAQKVTLRLEPGAGVAGGGSEDALAQDGSEAAVPDLLCNKETTSILLKLLELCVFSYGQLNWAQLV